jgi:hypothetical protein
MATIVTIAAPNIAPNIGIKLQKNTVAVKAN